MAEFCKQCTIDLFGDDVIVDLAGLTTQKDTALGIYARVICEGCGHTIVDHTGKCVSSNCLVKHLPC